MSYKSLKNLVITSAEMEYQSLRDDLFQIQFLEEIPKMEYSTNNRSRQVGTYVLDTDKNKQRVIEKVQSSDEVEIHEKKGNIWVLKRKK